MNIAELIRKKHSVKWIATQRILRRAHNNLSLKKKVDIKRSIQEWKKGDILVTDLEVTDNGIKSRGSFYV